MKESFFYLDKSIWIYLIFEDISFSISSMGMETLVFFFSFVSEQKFILCPRLSVHGKSQKNKNKKKSVHQRKNVLKKEGIKITKTKVTTYNENY